MALNEHQAGGPERDARLDRLYSEIGREHPREEVDDAIRAAARQAVGARPRPLGARLRRWSVPISIAAVIVVSVSLVTLMREEGAGRIEEGYAPPGLVESKEKPAEAVVGGAMGDARAPETTASPPPVSRILPQASPARPARDTVPQSAAEQASDDLATTGSDSARARVPAGQVGSRLEQAAKHSGEEREQAAYRDQKAMAPEAALERQAANKKSETDAPGTPAEPIRRLQSAPARADQGRASQPALLESEHLQLSDRVAPMVKALDKASPESWLEQIRVLRRAGRDEEADALLKEFKRRFPDHPLSESETGGGR